MTNWDYYFMHKPTNIKEVYPDPYGRIDDLLLDRRIKCITRTITAMIIFMALICVYITYPEWSWIFIKEVVQG